MSLESNTTIIQSLIEKIQSLSDGTTNNICNVNVDAATLCYVDENGLVKSETYDENVTLTVRKHSLFVIFDCASASSVSGATLLEYNGTVAAYLIEDDTVLTFG